MVQHRRAHHQPGRRACSSIGIDTAFGAAIVTTTYLSRGRLAQLIRLQTELYEHVIANARGRCEVCHEIEPCLRRNDLTQAILAYGCLPRRVPGLTKAGLRRVR